MPRNGAGSYSLPSGNPVQTGTTISSTTMNNTLSDLATAMSGSVSADGQTVMTGNLQMGGKKVTGLASGTASGDASTFGQLTAFLPSGTVLDFAGAAVPSGFLACDGSAVSRTVYSALYAAIGTTWGAGDGSTTFNVPDLRRRTTIGVGGTSVSGPAATVGSVGGEEAHVLTSTELPAHNHAITISETPHTHAITDTGHSHTWGNNTQVSAGAGAGNLGGSGTGTASPTTTVATGITINNATTGITATSANTGGGASHNNMQPSAVVNKIIKT